MKTLCNKKKEISRRQVLPFIGMGMLIPLLGFSYSKEKLNTPNHANFHTLLKPDGTVVQVSDSTLKKAKILKKNISNPSFFKWLTKFNLK